MLFKGKSAIVTGGTRGIGKEIVLMLAREGANVAFTYLKSDDQAKEIAKQVEALGSRCLDLKIDIKDFERCKELIEKVKEVFGGLDILVNNAGITRDKALMFMDKNDWQEVIDTNLTGLFNVTRHAIITFLKQKSGSILNITSVSGVTGMARQVNYAASKAGIIGFTKSLAKETAAYNIRVNALAPGFIDTDMTSGLKEEHKTEVIKRIPLARFGNVSNVADAAKFLLSDKAQFITGQVMIIDGGLSIA